MEKNGENWPDDIPGNCYTISVAQFRVEVQLVCNNTEDIANTLAIINAEELRI